MIANSLVECLGWTLLHSFWQLTLLAVLFGSTSWLLRGGKPGVRYVLAGLTLLAMLGGPLGTFVWLAGNSPGRPVEAESTSLISTSQSLSERRSPISSVPPNAIEVAVSRKGSASKHLGNDPQSNDSYSLSATSLSATKLSVESDSNPFRTLRSTVEPFLPGFVGVWLVGVLLLSCRQLGGLWVVERLRRRAAELACPSYAALMVELCQRLGIHRSIKCLESSQLHVPSVVGWFRPVILLPLGMLSKLPPDQLEAILLHELAHIRRRDFLVNGMQHVAETLLFYHPAVWWISKKMRLEREFCADDLAASASGNRFVYAKALANLEDHRFHSPYWAVAATGSDLRRRIERILGVNSHQPGQSADWLTGILATFLLVMGASWGQMNADVEVSPPVTQNQSSSTKATQEPVVHVDEAGQNANAAEPPAKLATPSAQEKPVHQEGWKENLWYAFQDLFAAAFEPTAPLAREYVFQVLTTDDQPVAGAAVTFTGLGLPSGSSLGGFPEGLIPVARSADDGTVRIDLSGLHESPVFPHLFSRLRGGVHNLYLQVKHPDHPPLSTSVWVADAPAPGARKIVLAGSQTIEIRARREGEDRLLRDLYPRLRGADDNWSETDGVLTIRRLDLTSQKASRWLRVVHAPEQGPVLFSDVIDLKQHTGNPISIEATLKPGVRIEGRISDEVPRPVKNGRVIAAVYSGLDSYDTVGWGAVAEVSPEGTFVVEPLPADEDVQLIALCDGWVSQSPTLPELDAYVETHGFALHPSYGQSYHLSGMVHPRLHRLPKPGALSGADIIIPMRRTSTCEITVVDRDGHPIPNAEVSFNPSPSQSFFRGGTFDLGTGWNSLASARALPASGEVPRDQSRVTAQPYKATSDERGVAIVSRLAGGWSRSSDGEKFPISVSHPDYVGQDGINAFGGFAMNGPSVTLQPGETGRITVRLHRK